MILTDSKGNKFAVHFHHYTTVVETTNHKKAPIQRRATSAIMHAGPCVDRAPRVQIDDDHEEKRLPCNTPGMVGAIAECSEKDVFNKLTGRKRSLGRAMIAAHIEKQQREELWKDFLQAVGITVTKEDDGQVQDR